MRNFIFVVLFAIWVEFLESKHIDLVTVLQLDLFHIFFVPHWYLQW